MEYKSPHDYLSIDDFYKVYGYACFYKADAESVDRIPIEEVTITLVSQRYPRKLTEHLQNIRKYSIEQEDEGIYYIKGDMIPIQLVIIGELSSEKNLWLSCLNDQWKSPDTIRKLLKAYQARQKNPLYRSVMDVIVRANRSCFEEVNGMSEALEELMEDVLRDKLDARDEKVRLETTSRMNTLILKLSQSGRLDELVKAASDKEYEQELFREFGL